MHSVQFLICNLLPYDGSEPWSLTLLHSISTVSCSACSCNPGNWKKFAHICKWNSWRRARNTSVSHTICSSVNRYFTLHYVVAMYTEQRGLTYGCVFHDSTAIILWKIKPQNFCCPLAKVSELFFNPAYFKLSSLLNSNRSLSANECAFGGYQKCWRWRRFSYSVLQASPCHVYVRKQITFDFHVIAVSKFTLWGSLLSF